MNNGKTTSSILAIGIWSLTNLIFVIGVMTIYYVIENNFTVTTDCISFFFVSCNTSFPILLVLLLLVHLIGISNVSSKKKFAYLILTCFTCASVYGLVFSFFDINSLIEWLHCFAYCTLALFIPSLIALALLHKQLNNYFSTTKINDHGTQ